MSLLKHVCGLCFTLDLRNVNSSSNTSESEASSSSSCSSASEASYQDACLIDRNKKGPTQARATLNPSGLDNPERAPSTIPAPFRQSLDALLSYVSIAAAATSSPNTALTQPLPNTTDSARQLREASYHSIIRSITSNPADRDNFIDSSVLAPLAGSPAAPSLSPTGPSKALAHSDTTPGVVAPTSSRAQTPAALAQMLATMPIPQYRHQHHQHHHQHQEHLAQTERAAGTTAGPTATDTDVAQRTSLSADLGLAAAIQRHAGYACSLDEFQRVRRPTGVGFDDLNTLDLTLDFAVATPTALMWSEADACISERSDATVEGRPQERRMHGTWQRPPTSQPPPQQSLQQQSRDQALTASQYCCICPSHGSANGGVISASESTMAAAPIPTEASGLPEVDTAGHATERAMDGQATKTQEAGAPLPGLQQRDLLNLSQVAECVTELRVLHIRPGAALLVGKATATGKHVMARFERGQPAQLLAPQLLTILLERGALLHPNIAATLGVYTVALPSHVFDSTPVPSPHPCLGLGPGLGLKFSHGSEVGPHMSLGAGSIGIDPGPRLPMCAMSPLPAPSARYSSPLSRRIGNNSFIAGLDLDRLECGWPLSLVNERDMATATLALQQAEAVRGATTGSGIIGSAVHSTATTSSASTRLLHAMVGPQVRLRDVVGHLRSAGGRGGGGEVTGMGFPPGGGEHDRITQAPIDGAAAAAAAAAESNVPQSSTGGGAIFGSFGVAFVTLTLTELCEGSNLYDEARRGVFACYLSEPLPPPLSSSSSSTLTSVRPGSDRVFRNHDLMEHIERFLCTATELARVMRFLHLDCGLAHGDLVSRNVLLQRHTSNGTEPKVGGSNMADGRAGAGGGGGGSAYVVKLTGYGRLASPPPSPLAQREGEGEVASPVDGARGVGGGGGGGGFLRLSTTSLTRINTVHVGLWRDVHSLAPERLMAPDTAPSFEADVYAYGSILYEMVMGESPWAGMTPACVAVGAATGDLRISCPTAALPSIATLIERCTARLPVDRPSVEEVIAALGSIREEVHAGREMQLVRQQQRDACYIMQTFLETDSDSNVLY